MKIDRDSAVVTEYKYFVSYAFKTGFGRCEMTLACPIQDMDAVEHVEKKIQEKHPEMVGVIVTGWQKWEMP